MLKTFRVTRVKRGMVILMVAVVIVFSQWTRAAANTAVAGVVRDASGEPVAGAIVKVQSTELGLAFVAISQAQGRYTTPNLLPGNYTVQAIGGDRQSGPAGPIEVKSGQQAKLDVVMNTPRRMILREKRFTLQDYANVMPEGEGKKLIMGRCVLCHGLDRIVPARKPRKEWETTVDRMRENLLANRVPLSDQERDVILNYVVKNFGPDAPTDRKVVGQLVVRTNGPSEPNRHFAPALLQGAGAHYVAMEFNLPQAGSRPHDIAVDSQGIAWVSERNGKLGRFDPTALTYTRIDLPRGKTTEFALQAVAVDPRDQVWFTDEGKNLRLLQYSPKSREFNSYPIPDSGGAHVNSLAFRDGEVWGTGMAGSRIVKWDLQTRKFTEYPVQKGSSPYGLAIGGDKAVWYAAQLGNTITRLDPQTGELKHYKMSTARADVRRMQADMEGNLWIAATDIGKLVKVDYRTGKMTEYAPPTHDPGPYSVDVDRKRNLIWVNGIYADNLARFDPRINTFVEFALPSADADVRRIAVDRNNPNRVWWSGNNANKIGYVEAIE